MASEAEDYRRMAAALYLDGYALSTEAITLLAAAFSAVTAAARDAALEEAADVSEAHSCGRACADRGLGPICGDVIAAAIRALKERA